MMIWMEGYFEYVSFISYILLLLIYNQFFHCVSVQWFKTQIPRFVGKINLQFVNINWVMQMLLGNLPGVSSQVFLINIHDCVFTIVRFSNWQLISAHLTACAFQPIS